MHVYACVCRYVRVCVFCDFILQGLVMCKPRRILRLRDRGFCKHCRTLRLRRASSVLEQHALSLSPDGLWIIPQGLGYLPV